MKRILLFTLLAFAGIALFQAEAASRSEFEPAFMDSHTVKGRKADEGIDTTTVTIPQDPPTILLLAVGLMLLTGIGWRSRGKSAPQTSCKGFRRSPVPLFTLRGRLLRWTGALIRR
jgi:hypothetical protein